MELVARGIGQTYPRAAAPALDDVSAWFGDGVTAVVGVNGAGKSTLLRILARAHRPQRGRVTLDASDIYRAPRQQIAPRIALMPQDFTLPPGTRVLDGLIYLGWLKGLPGPDAAVRGAQVLASVGLAGRAQDRVASLSGGMVRRLALAQALVSRPDVLLLDEPTTGLDPEQRVAVRELLADGEHRARITLISSHVMEDVEALADRILLLHQGKVCFAGTLEEFSARPDGSSESAEAAFLRRIVGVSR